MKSRSCGSGSTAVLTAFAGLILLSACAGSHEVSGSVVAVPLGAVIAAPEPLHCDRASTDIGAGACIVEKALTTPTVQLRLLANDKRICRTEIAGGSATPNYSTLTRCRAFELSESVVVTIEAWDINTFSHDVLLGTCRARGPIEVSDDWNIAEHEAFDCNGSLRSVRLEISPADDGNVTATITAERGSI